MYDTYCMWFSVFSPRATPTSALSAPAISAASAHPHPVLLTHPIQRLWPSKYRDKRITRTQVIVAQWSYCVLSQTKTNPKYIQTVTRSSPAQLKSCDWGSFGEKQPAISRGYN